MHSGSLSADDRDELGDSTPPPPYDGTLDSVNLSQDGLDTKANVSSMSLSEKSLLY